MAKASRGKSVVLTSKDVEWLPSNMLAIVTRNSRRCRVDGLNVSSKTTELALRHFLKSCNPSSDEIGTLGSAILSALEAVNAKA
jgi:hypothetical protein